MRASIQRPTHSQSAVLRSVLSVLVCVSLLQLPIPVMHQHTDFGSFDSLSHHVERHHDGSCEVDDEFHWHFVLPSELGHDDESDSEESFPSTVATVANQGSQAISCTGNGWSSELSLVRDHSVRLAASHFSDSGPPSVDDRPPLFTPKSSVYTRAILCVVRC